MKNAILVIIVGLFSSTAYANAGGYTNQAFNLRLYGLAEQLEYDDILAEESGQLFGIGGEVGLKIVGPLWLECRGELFGGETDQETYLAIQTTSGKWIKSDTTIQIDTTYKGVDVGGVLACNMPIVSGFNLKPYGGLGVRKWIRTMDHPTYGVEEDWTSIYGIIGCGGGIAVGKNSELFGRIEARLHFDNSVKSDFEDPSFPIPDGTKLEPEGEFSGYAEVGINISPMTASIFAESLNLSEPAPSHQEYKATMYGVKLGLAF